MNLFQRFNVTATFAAVVAASNGISTAFTGSRNPTTPNPSNEKYLTATSLEIHGETLIIASFIILFMFKACFENHLYFEEPKNEPEKSRNPIIVFLGFILGALSWLGWIIAGSICASPLDSILAIVASLVISTVWVLLHLVEMFRLEKLLRTLSPIYLIRDLFPIVTWPFSSKERDEDSFAILERVAGFY